ncbi:hypothetical protein C1H46_032107 [Malus baccata]|uniref:Uncharacterized protein n=1 Tax=Malus baccata TaxID=106549 RepID=A0A540L787_MALBA|nr:hypothetical protein C1H46_032107 [Malus baccata]
MAQIPNLDNAPLNLTSLRFEERSVWSLIRSSAALSRRSSRLRSSRKLFWWNLDCNCCCFTGACKQEHGIELRHLSADPIQTDCSKLVYLILEEEKVHHLLTIGEYPLYIVPLDEDVLSFELDLSCKECLVDGDTSSLWHIANTIHKLEFSFGVIPNVRAKGKGSVRVADILNRMQAEEPVNSPDMVVPEINTLILLDREVDMVTPMCSQLTYEGLLDEFLHINNGAVELDASFMGAAQQEGKKMKVPLNSSDKLFKELRDLNFEVVGQILCQKAQSMKQDYTDVTSNTQTVSELKDFVKKLNSLPEMTRHINLAQHLSTFTSKTSFLGQLDMEHTIIEGQSYDICFEHIEEMIHKQEPLVNVLRVLILFSITNSGLPKKHFDYLRQETKSNWLTVKRALQLVVEDTDTANPNDISYVFSGYAPLSIRLIQHAVRSGWRPIEEILRLLPEPHSEIKRGRFSSSPSLDTLQGHSANVDKVSDGRRSLVLVVFVGGVTFVEISALRFLSAREGMAYDLIIGTTKIANGRSLIETFVGS